MRTRDDDAIVTVNDAPGPRWLTVLGGLAVGIALGFVVIARQQGRSVLDSMWAEDGSIFVQQAHERGFETLLVPYAGYLHVPSRVLAGATTAFPLEAAAALMSGSAAILVGLIAVFVWKASGEVIRSRLVRIVLAASVVFVPVARIESLSNVANLHFYLVFAAFWALVWRPRHLGALVLESGVVAAAALSDPLVLLLAPVALVRWFAAPDRAGRLPVVTWAVAVAIHGVIIVGSGLDATTGSPTTPDPVAIVILYPLRVVAGAIIGLQRTWDLWEPVGAWVIVAGSVAIVALVAVAIVRMDDRRRLLVMMSVGLSAAFFVVASWIRWDPALAPGTDGGFLRDAVRYLLLPVLFLLVAIAILVDDLLERDGPVASVAVAMVAVLILSGWWIDFTGPNRRTASPSWQESIQDARARCSSGSPSEVTIPIAPATWTMRLSCDVLTPRS